ncbi:hypothetical protein B0H67DRAFT_209179 [Lasiosphaeris hirsuta]|uniref:Uncharacterized protein n=1 Tax=Lasiosphaeris hirsuta TaxID=260670 RepID=A0AA40AS34_9PEZI|nr:hypothetical protein B0H67DRAFT_209179 [Lasiosphaeris hirsuta]
MRMQYAALALSDGNLAGNWSDASARRAVVSCRRASSELEISATEIQRRLRVQSSMRRKLAGLKAVLTKDEVAVLERRLESAIRVLTLTQNPHLMHLVRSQHELVMERLEVTTGRVLAPVERPIPQLADVSIGAERTVDATLEESASEDKFESQGAAWPSPPKTGQLLFRRAPGGFNARIVTPITGLAVQRRWELLVSRSYLGWKIALQPFLHSPDDKLLIKLARAGAVNDLQYLFLSRQAVIGADDDFHDNILYVRTLCRLPRNLTKTGG